MMLAVVILIARDHHLGHGDGMTCPFCSGNGFRPDKFWAEDGDQVRRFYCELCGQVGISRAIRGLTGSPPRC